VRLVQGPLRGLSWQVVPRQLNKALTGPDREGANRAMQAMLQMRKIDIATIEKPMRPERLPHPRSFPWT